MRRVAFLILMTATIVGVSACGGGDEDDSATGDTSATTAADPRCDAVGDTDTPATSDLDVTLDEWTIKYEGDGAAAGAVQLVVHNEGDVEHELAIENPAGKLVGEIEPFAPGTTCEGTYDLSAPGTYTLLCEVVDEDGMSHAEHGMRTQLTVK